MKKKTIICSILIWVLSAVIASMAMAECPPGKTEVTIVAGKKIIEICVPDQAVDKIGGPGEVVIPATCPCFTQEDVENAIANDPTANGYMEIGTYEGTSTLYFSSMLYTDGFIFRANSPLGPSNEVTEVYWFNECDPPCPIPPGICKQNGSIPFCRGSIIDDCFATPSDDEARACLAILQTLDWVPEE